MNKKLKGTHSRIINRDGKETESKERKRDSKSSPITPAVCKRLQGIFQHLPANDDTVYFIDANKQTGTALPSLNLFINPCFTTLNTSSLWAYCPLLREQHAQCFDWGAPEDALAVGLYPDSRLLERHQLV